MKTNAERMYLVQIRSVEMRNRREIKKLNFCKAVTAVLSIVLLCCTAAIPSSYKSASVTDYCGTIVLIDGMGGYVLTAVAAFISATVITVTCIKMKNRRNQK